MKTQNAFPLRINNELIEKIRYISKDNSRSINKEIEFIIKKYIEKYENYNGKIKINLKQS